MMEEPIEYGPLHGLLQQMKLTTGDFHKRLVELGHPVPTRTLRHYLAPVSAPSYRQPPDWLMSLAREMAGKTTGSEWIVGTDDLERRIVIHATPPRFAAVMKGRDTVAFMDWWDKAEKNGIDWSDAARRASERFYHRSYKKKA